MPGHATKKENQQKTERDKNDRETQEKLAELKQKKKEMEEEIDDLSGSSSGGKAVCVLVFLAVVLALLGIFTAMVKLDVGGIASETLAPAIGEVPVLRSILPADLQRQTPAEQSAAAQAAADSEAAAQAAADSEAAAQAAADSEAAAQAAADSEAALKDYVDTYSSMKAKDAAKVFDSMMPDQTDLVVKILEQMTPDQRSAILAKMTVSNSADITVKMDEQLPQ